MALIATIVFPLLLLGGMIAMERVERPLRDEAVGEQVVHFLDTARPDEVETFVSEGTAPALERYWRRRNRFFLGRRSATGD